MGTTALELQPDAGKAMAPVDMSRSPSPHSGEVRRPMDQAGSTEKLAEPGNPGYQ
jgi:hypothetical protein